MAGLGLLAGCGLISPRSQPAVRTPRIGYLWTGAQEWADAFREGLAELGYVEGSTVTVEWRPADGQVDRLPELAAELVSMPVDVIVASGALPIQAAMRATSTIPIVMARTGDPVADGFVASLARPGGNVTGQTSISRELIGKRLEILRQALPSVSRVGVIWNPDPALRPGRRVADSGGRGRPPWADSWCRWRCVSPPPSRARSSERCVSGWMR